VRVEDLSAAGGTITNYAALSLDNEMEMKVQAATPTKLPPAGVVKIYPKLSGGNPKLYAKDAAGTEFDLSGSGGGSILDSERVKAFAFSNATASPATIFTPPASAVITRVTVIMDTPASGNGASIAIGIAGNTGRDLVNGDTDLRDGVPQIGSEPLTQVGATPASIIATILTGSQTFSGRAYIRYVNPS